MAIKKAITKADIETPDEVQPEVTETPDGTLVRSPQGFETTVPADILDILLDSGYTKI